MTEYSDATTISMSSSKFSWEDVDAHCKKNGYNRSKYIQTLVENDLGDRKLNRFYRYFVAACLGAILALNILLLLFLWS